MGRYDEQIEEILPDLDAIPIGKYFIEVPPREQEAVAACIPEGALGERVSLEDASKATQGPPSIVVVGLGPKGERRTELIRELDARREWLSRWGRKLTVIADPEEMRAIERHAASLFSARSYDAPIKFVPDPAVDPVAARAELTRYLDAKYGRLDLRGFVRAESEDVSFRVEDIYQGLKVRLSADDLIEPRERSLETGDFSVTDVDRALENLGSRDAPVAVILGNPGSGKSFLLRRLALSGARESSLLGVENALPVLVSLGEFARSPWKTSILQHVTTRWLEEGLSAAHVLAAATKERRAVFLLDGLDEVADPANRAWIRDAIVELHEQANPRLVVVTSRIVGYEADARLGAVELPLQPFDDEAVRAFLVAWCEHYAVDRLGPTDLARAEGRKEGEELAKGVMASPSVHALASNPLMLTILAIVHRAGVRLPEHRVELYDQATRVLVERWNRVRGAGPITDAAPPFKSADAARLLGPLALKAIESGTAGAIPEAMVRSELDKVIRGGVLRGLSVDQAIQLFTETLGLLVEQGPGQFAFLHLTLGEYFAAWELVRSSRLEEHVASPALLFSGTFQEVLLLALGILGVLRADDERAGQLVDRVVAAASAAPGPVAGPLLGGILADDPLLSATAGAALIGALVPAVSFESFPMLDSSGQRTLLRQMKRGRWADPLLRALEAFYSTTPSAFCEPARRHDLERVCDALKELGADYGFQVVTFFSQILPHQLEATTPHVLRLPTFSDVSASADGRWELSFTVSRTLDESARQGSLPLKLSFRVGLESIGPVPWNRTSVIREQPPLRWLQIDLGATQGRPSLDLQPVSVFVVP